MRIALITARNPLSPAGRPLHETALARAMTAQGHRVTLYCRAEQDRAASTAVAGGVTAEFVPAGPARPLPADQVATCMPALAAALADRWRTRRPDVVHAFGWTAGLAALGAVRGTSMPVVQSFGSLGIAERRARLSEAVPGCRIRLEQAIGRAADAVLAGSADEAADLARLSVPRAAIRVIPCGIDTGQFTAGGTAAAGKGAAARIITFAAEPDALGVADVLRAVALLPETELVIVGGPDGKHLPKAGPFRDLARLATELKIRGRVLFAGRVARAELAELLRSARIAASASPHEPEGVAAIQAMACGVPVVVAAAGAHRDAVVEGINGLLVAPLHPAMLASRLHYLLSAPALLQAFGIAAADRASARYGWDRIARETIAVYQRSVQARSAAAEAAIETELAELDATAAVELDLPVATLARPA